MSNLPQSQPGENVNQTTSAFFKSYFNKSLPVSTQVYDVVLTFFLARTDGDRTAAEALTASVMILAQNKGIDPMSIIEQFQGMTSNVAFKAALLSLLNTDRQATSKLGYSVTPAVNPYILRNISK